MARIAGACRFVFNLALEQRRDWYRPGRQFDFITQCREITQLRAEVEWLREVPVHALQQAVKDLDHAYRNWWSGRTKAPVMRKKGAVDSFRFPDPTWMVLERTGRSSGRIKLPKLGWVQLRGWRDIDGKIRNATVQSRAGSWYVVVQWQMEEDPPGPSVLPPVGVDLGVEVFAATSDGTLVSPARCLEKALPALRRAQRRAARKCRGSANRRKAAHRVSKVYKHIVNSRNDFLHKVTTAIAKNHGVVVVEDIDIAGLVTGGGRKAALNRAVLDQGWGRFRTMLAYKLADRGGRLIVVPAAYTSQTCSECGNPNPGSRRSRSRFRCVHCGYAEHADTNAAKNILRRGLGESSRPVEGHRNERPAEAGSNREAA